jgi:sodium-dependent dicarboxylate transporter 2/3/5
VTEALPFAATSLLVVLLIPAFGIAEFREVVRASFGDPVIVFFIGVLILAAAFTLSGLGTRLTYLVLLRVGTRTSRVLLGFLIVGTLISMWITDIAVAAMLFPLGVGLLRDAGLRPAHSNFGRALMIATAFGPLIGGIATPAGTAANLVAIAQLKQLAHVDVSFWRWMGLGVPASLLMIPFAWRILLWMFPPELDRLPISTTRFAIGCATSDRCAPQNGARCSSSRRSSRSGCSRRFRSKPWDSAAASPFSSLAFACCRGRKPRRRWNGAA